MLLNTPWEAENKAIILKELNAMGIEGAAFYDRHYRIVEKYYAAFQKRRVESPGTELFAGADEFVLSVYVGLLRRNPGWFTEIASVPNHLVSDAVSQVIMRELKGQTDIIAGLDTLGLSDQSKWQIILLLQKSKRQMQAVIQAILDNIPAFEEARSEIEGDLTGLFLQFENALRRPNREGLPQLPPKLPPSVSIVPTLALPFAVLVMEGVCFYGLLTNTLSRSAKGELSKEEILICAKALSEKSKLDILLCLRDTNLYNLEIADRVGLTPATVSHHMQVLLSAGFVHADKKQGKVFYRLSPTGIRRFLAGSRQLLL